MIITCMVIDDEPSSQQVLRKFIGELSFLKLVHTCNNALEAMTYLNTNTDIDLLFLDINMPKISGISFYKSLQDPPYVIFTTAYSQYAVEGFEVNAIDYLLKPFSFDRFFIAVSKVLNKQKGKQGSNDDHHYIMVKSNKTLHKIFTKDIFYLEALGDYVKIYLEDTSVITNSTFQGILHTIPKTHLIRIHKSFAINPHKLNSICGNRVLLGIYTVPIGQKFKADFLKYLS
ncbi:response regulator transcription factor [Ascidiimonas aurantiaca]|uniref:LytR/AlgR family response regulator transcription factor n=1 Tax=Ascidiimonas aurantiaca TaxID=1685432 RepID=UPI0030EE06EE